MNGTRTLTVIRMSRARLEQLLSRAEAGLEKYLRDSEDEAIERLREWYARPKTLWEKIFFLKRPDTSRWPRHQWIRAVEDAYYSSSSFRLPPWSSYCLADENAAIHRARLVIKYNDGESDIAMDPHDVDVLQNIGYHADVKSEQDDAL